MVAQAPNDTFAGAISIDFCPELRLRKPLCETGALHFADSKKKRALLTPAKLDDKWIALQTRPSGACGKDVTQRFASATPDSEMVMLTKDAGPANLEDALSTAVRRLDPPS